ncbi:MAG: TipJ family phage tail tip protein, partial [bacterium]
QEVRLGLPTQAICQGFQDTITDTAVSTKLSWPDLWVSGTTYYYGDLVEYPEDSGSFWSFLQDDVVGPTPSEGSYWTADENWTTRRTSGDAITGFSITFNLPKGLFYANNSGGTDENTVLVYMEYRKVGDAEWIPYQTVSTVTTYISTARWSAGYWIEYPEDWFEVEAGSTTYTDHEEGDFYTPSTWNETEEEFAAMYVWRWINTGTVRQIDQVVNDYITVQEATASPLHIAYKRYIVPEGQYDIRCKLVAKPISQEEDNPRYVDDIYWESFSEIVKDDFTYPGTALLAIRAMATDQLSGSMPRVTCLVTRSTVPVYDGVSAYEQNSASNPAWASYHVLHKALYKNNPGVGDDTDPDNYEVHGVPASRMIYADFESWADWCDGPGPGPWIYAHIYSEGERVTYNGSVWRSLQDNNIQYVVEGSWWTNVGNIAPFTLGLYVDSPFSVRRTLDMIGANGRGAATQIGSKFTALVDRPEELPVQRFLFGRGNIEGDSWQEEFLPMDDRATAC